MIREEQAGDAPAIAALLAEAFGRDAEAALVERLRRDGDVLLSLVAADDRGLVGHVLFSRMQAPFRAAALAPLAVLPRHQRQGIGTRLIEAGLARLARDGWEGVVVLGAPSYYRRFGFDAALAQGFVSPYAGPHLMICPLRPSLPVKTGALVHAPAFDDPDL